MSSPFSDWMQMAWFGFFAAALMALTLAIIIYAVWLAAYAIQQRRTGKPFRWSTALRLGYSNEQHADASQPASRPAEQEAPRGRLLH